MAECEFCLLKNQHNPARFAILFLTVPGLKLCQKCYKQVIELENKVAEVVLMRDKVK